MKLSAAKNLETATLTLPSKRRRKKMSKQTVLNALHRSLGAKMVDFGGWDMPIQYSAQIAEHHAVRAEGFGLWGDPESGAPGLPDVDRICPTR